MEFIIKYNDGETRGYKTIECEERKLNSVKKAFEKNNGCKVSFIAYKEVYNLLVDYIDTTNKTDLFSARVQDLTLGYMLLDKTDKEIVERALKEVEFIQTERHIKRIEKLNKKISEWE